MKAILVNKYLFIFEFKKIFYMVNNNLLFAIK